MIRRLVLGALLSLLAAPAFADYTFLLNVDGYANNTAWTSTQMQATLNSGVSYSADNQGSTKFVYIVSAATKGGTACTSGHKCLEYRIPAGDVGATPGGALSSYGTLQWVASATGATIVNAEWDVLLETGYDLHSLGKIAPQVGVYDTTQAAYMTERSNWGCNGTHTATTCNGTMTRWSAYLHDKNGADLSGTNCAGAAETWPIVTNTWYHFHFQINQTTTNHPVTKAWIKRPSDPAEVLLFNCTWNPPAGNVNTAHSLRLEFSTFFGGAGNNDKATVDSYWLQDNLHIYSGATSPTDTTAPTVPANLAVTTPLTSLSGNTMTWSASTDPDSNVFTYHLKRDGVEVYAGGQTTFSDSGLTPGQTYAYTIDACDATPNCSDFSDATNVAMSDVVAPSVPTNLLATFISPTQVNLSWSASTDNIAVTGYKLYRDAVQIADQAGRTFNDTGRTPDTTYNYTVLAYDAAPNSSSQSGQVPIHTLSDADVEAPTTPTNVHLTALGATQLNLAWTASTDNVAVEGYRVKRCAGQTCSNYALVATVIGTAYSDPGLTAKTNYNYVIEAIDGVPNVSSDSTPLKVQTELAVGNVTMHLQGNAP